MQCDSESIDTNGMGYVKVHKTPAGGVPEKKWYIAEVRVGMERVCRERLLRSGIESYVASRIETRVYASRNRRIVEQVVIPAKLFVHIPDDERVPVLQTCSPAIYKFMIDHAGRPNNLGVKPYAIVPDEQMQRLRFMLGQAERPVEFASRPLHLGDRVRVIRGPLRGLEGSFLRQGRSTYIVVLIETLGYTFTEIQQDDVECVS